MSSNLNLRYKMEYGPPTSLIFEINKDQYFFLNAATRAE